MDTKVLDKIKKLLSLADNNSNNSDEEAMSALLKAQELMAKHNITTAQVDEETQEMFTHVYEMAESKWNMGFRIPLANVISSNFRCKLLLRNRCVTFFGRAEDTKIAKEAFEYAYTFVMREANRHYNRAYVAGKKTKGVFNSYASGFITGLQSRFDEQCRALVITTPKDVETAWDEYSKTLSSSKQGMKRTGSINHEAYSEGLRDGMTALDSKRIK